MNQFYAAWATCMFELRSSFTIQRASVTAVMALFPPVMLLLLIGGSSVIEGGTVPSQMGDFAPFLSIFLIALVQLLSLLLWATPNVYSELEGKSWVFLASRPGGRISVFLGKFMASVIVGFTISFVAVTACILIQHLMLGSFRPMRTWLAMNFVFFLAAWIYSALFSAIGTVFIKRAMLVGAGYLLAFDVIIGLIPQSIINKFTVRYHLQEVGVGCMGWFFPSELGSESEYRMLFGDAWPTWAHVLFIVAATLAFLALGVYVVVKREYITSDQT